MRLNSNSENPIMITGGSGVIGSSLSEMLTGCGEKIVIYDVRDSQFGYGIKGDIRDTEKLKDSITRCHVRGIIHMAGLSQVARCEQNPELCWDVNVGGARSLAIATLSSGLNPWILNISSREVYGQQNIMPVSEDATINPLNVYGQSKCASEDIIKNLCGCSNINALTLRLSNVYGCLNDINTRAIPAFISAALDRRPMILYGGEQILDFVHIHDVNNGIAQAINLLDNKPKVDYDVINIASGRPCKIKDVASIVSNCCNDIPTIRFMPQRPHDVCSFVGDTNKAHDLLEFKTSISVETGIPLTFRLYDHGYDREKVSPPVAGGVYQ